MKKPKSSRVTQSAIKRNEQLQKIFKPKKKAHSSEIIWSIIIKKKVHNYRKSLKSTFVINIVTHDIPQTDEETKVFSGDTKCNKKKRHNYRKSPKIPFVANMVTHDIPQTDEETKVLCSGTKFYKKMHNYRKSPKISFF